MVPLGRGVVITGSRWMAEDACEVRKEIESMSHNRRAEMKTERG